MPSERCAPRVIPRIAGKDSNARDLAHSARIAGRQDALQVCQDLQGIERQPMASLILAVFLGAATWYGDSFAGQPTALGVPYDPSAISAACHPALLGEWLLVTNTDNGWRLPMRCADTGPFRWTGEEWEHLGMGHIDLSRAAFARLAPLAQGVMQVKIEWIGERE